MAAPTLVVLDQTRAPGGGLTYNGTLLYLNSSKSDLSWRPVPVRIPTYRSLPPRTRASICKRSIAGAQISDRKMQHVTVCILKHELFSRHCHHFLHRGSGSPCRWYTACDQRISACAVLRSSACCTHHVDQSRAARRCSAACAFTCGKAGGALGPWTRAPG